MGRRKGSTNKSKENKFDFRSFFKPDDPSIPEEVLDARIKDHFESLKIISDSTARGLHRSLIVSGPSGIGKSFEIEKAVKATDSKFIMVTGNVQPTGVYKILFEHRDAGSVVVFDDSDGIFFEPLSLNLLKAACDTKQTRTLFWLSERSLKDTYSDPIPNSFEFNGSIIFITNYNFDRMIEKEHKLTPHLQALMSRAHYLDMYTVIGNQREYIIRLKQVIKEGLLNQFTQIDRDILINYIADNKDNLRELSIRMMIKIGQLIQMDKQNWRKLADTMCLKR